MPRLRLESASIPINQVHVVRGNDDDIVDGRVRIDEVVPRSSGSGDTSVLVSCRIGSTRQEFVLRLDAELAIQLHPGDTAAIDLTDERTGKKFGILDQESN